MPTRSQCIDQEAVNPFKSRTGNPTFPQCIWEVLIDHREGLSIASIVEEVQQRGLRDLSGLKNPHGQVANNLGRHLDQFTHNNHLWGLRLYEPAVEEPGITAKSQDVIEQAGTAEDNLMDAGSSQAAAATLSTSSGKRATRSSSPAINLAGAQLIGLACTLWWDGEQEWYPGMIESWEAANSTYTIQYDDGDQETGAVFNRYSLEQSHDGHQVVKVHEFKPGKYVPRAAHVEDDDGAALTSTTKQLVQDMSVPGAGDASDEDLPLSTLAERHPSQPNPAAEASRSQAEDVAVSKATGGTNKASAAAPPTQVVKKAPASSKATFKAHTKAGTSEAAANSQTSNHSEAQISAVAEATTAPASQGSPEPSPAAAAVQPESRTTRSRSKRMSTEASPSISIASKQSMQNESEGKATLAKPPSGRRKRSITPAHPPPQVAAAASPAPAEAAAANGTAAKAASASKKRQRTPDTATGPSRRPVPSRRSSRLSATTLDQPGDSHHEEEDFSSRPVASEAAGTIVDTAPADISSRPMAPEAASAPEDAASADKPHAEVGLQLGSAATADEEQRSAPADAAAAHTLAQASDTADATAVILTDALHCIAPTRAAGGAGEATDTICDAVSLGLVVELGAAVVQNQRASAEMLHPADHPAQAEGHMLDEPQGTTGAESAAVSEGAAGKEDLPATSGGKLPTDSKDEEAAQGTTAGDISEGGAAAANADASAYGPTDSAEDVPLAMVAPSVAAGARPPLEEAQAPINATAAAAAAAATAAAAAAAAAASVEDASGAVQAAATGSGSAATSADDAAEHTGVTEPLTSAEADGQHTTAPDTLPDASMSVAAPGAVKPSSPTAADASATNVIALSPAVPAESAAAAASAAQAEAVESVASAQVRPPVASSDAPTASKVQSAGFPANASTAQAAAAPPPATFAAAASVPAAILKTLSIPKLPQTSGSTRIGLPNRPSSLSMSVLGAAQQKGGTTHLRPILGKGLTPLAKPDRGSKVLHQSTSEGTTGSKRKRDVSPASSLQQAAEAKSRSKGSKQASGRSRESTVSPNEATGPIQAQEPSSSVFASSPTSLEGPSMPQAASAHMLPVKHPHISTALPHALTPPAEQLAPQSSQPLLAQLATQGHLLMSQPTSRHQQLQGSISPRQQEPEDKSGRVRIPLHKGVGLVKLCIPAGPQSGFDRRPPQDAAVPLLVAKYSAWPFACLWPESPPSQPPPLPSQSPSPSPPPMPPTHPVPSHRPSDTQPARTVSRHVPHGTEPVAGAADFHRPAAAVPQAQTAVAATAHRPFGKQAPKVLLDPSVGPFQPASKRQRGAVSVSPDDGRFVGPHASSRNPGETSRPSSASKSASKIDTSSRPTSSVDPTPPSKAASSPLRSHERRAASHYSESQHTKQDSSHRSVSHRGHDHPRSSSHDFRREHGHDRYRSDDRSYQRSHTHDRDSGRRHRSRSTSSSSRTSSNSRGRHRHSSGHHDSHSYRQAQQPRVSGTGTRRDRDSSRDNRHQASHHRDERDRYPRADRSKGSGRDRYDGSRGKQAHATHSHGSRSERPDRIGDRRGATDPPRLSLSPRRGPREPPHSSLSPRRVGREPPGLSLNPRRGARDPPGISLSPRIGARGPPGLSLSPSRRSHTASVSPAATPGASLALPEGFRNGRIFWSSDRTFRECMDKRLFAAKDERDIKDIGADTAVFLWNCFQRELHGVWVSTKQGNLEPYAFGGKFRCQARVREEHMFAKPLPIESVLPILPRLPGRPGTSFEQHLDRDQVCKVWNAFVRYNQS